MSNFENIEVDINVETQRLLLTAYVEEQFSEPSVNLFHERSAEYLENQDIDVIFKAVGEAALNESLIEAIKNEIERKKEERYEYTDETEK